MLPPLPVDDVGPKSDRTATRTRPRARGAASHLSMVLHGVRDAPARPRRRTPADGEANPLPARDGRRRAGATVPRPAPRPEFLPNSRDVFSLNINGYYRFVHARSLARPWGRREGARRGKRSQGRARRERADGPRHADASRRGETPVRALPGAAPRPAASVWEAAAQARGQRRTCKRRPANGRADPKMRLVREPCLC